MFKRNNHHHVVLPAQISLILFVYPSLSSIAPGRSSRLHPVLAKSCCMYVLASRHRFARLCEGFHRSMSLMSLSLLIQQCPACLVGLSWIDFLMGCKWQYCCYFVRCSQHSCLIAVKLFLHTFSYRLCSASI